MKEKPAIQPPQWARRILVWYCKPELLEDLEGDLHEYFQRNVSAKGQRKANLIYVIDVIKFFRPYTIRKPEFINTLIHWIMLGSYIKTSGRSIVRNKLFSFINIFGLSVSMTVGLLMIAMLYDVFQYDKFHEHHDRIYRLTSTHTYLDHFNDEKYATTSFMAAKAIKESFTGVDDVAIFRREFSGDVTYQEKTLPLSGYFGNGSVFSVFTFPLVQGNPETALQEPFSLVLTEKSALKLFGETNVVGRIVQYDHDRQYTITGVVSDPPKFSHIKFDMLASISTREIIAAESKSENAWDNIWDTWVYVLLNKDADLKLFQENLDKLSEQGDKTTEHTHIALALSPMDNIMTGENHSNEIGPVLGGTVIKVFSILAFVVVLSACFNYTNLSIARTFRRSKEVGIRKTIGALKSHVAMQFTVESVIISLLALFLAFGLFLLLRSHYISIENSFQQLLVMDLSPALILWFLGFAILVGILAGIFPAIFFSRLNAIQVLKNLSVVPRLRGFTIRKILIVFQYTVSIIAITATIIIYKQYKHFVAFDLGFSTANILNIRLQGNKAELLKKELAELPEVKGISQSSLIQGIGNYWGTSIKNPAFPLDSGTAFYNIVDENYLPLHDYELISGENFKPGPDEAEDSEVIINEHVLTRFNIAGQDPQKAVGEMIKVNGTNLKIAGVMKNFYYGKADNNRSNKEVIMRYSGKDAQYLNAKILSSDWPETYARIETIWKKIDSVHPFEAKFYDQEIEESYNGLKAAMKVGGFLAFLVICIASIGLFGMVVFTTETRLKEISIRKVLGASEGGLLYLLAKGFMVLLLIAALIGLPVTFIFFNQIILPEVGNAAPVSMFEMSIGVLAVLAIALVMVGSHTLRVSRTNPAEVLKSE